MTRRAEKYAADGDTPGRFLAWLRRLAGAGAILSGWIAIDSLAGTVPGAGRSADPEFFLFWGLPFAVASVFLAWFAVRGGRREAREIARSGCLGSLVLGSAVFLLYFASPLILHWDALTGAVAAFLYGPPAAVIGLGIGIAVARTRQRRRSQGPGRPFAPR